MNEDTKSVLNEFLAQLLDGLKSAGAFVSDQLPLVLHEYVVWGIVSSAIWLIPGLIMCAYAPKVFRWAWDAMDRTDGATAMVCVFYPAVALLFTMIPLQHMLKAIFAPRVYLIDAIGSMIH